MHHPFPKAPRYHVRTILWRGCQRRWALFDWNNVQIIGAGSWPLKLGLPWMLSWLRWQLESGRLPMPPRHPEAGYVGAWHHVGTDHAENARQQLDNDQAQYKPTPETFEQMPKFTTDSDGLVHFAEPNGRKMGVH